MNTNCAIFLIMQVLTRLWGIFVLYICLIDAFRINVSNGRCQRMASQLQMASPKPPGISNTKEGKKVILERTKAVVNNTTMIMAIPVHGVSNDQIAKFKKLLPPGTKASMVKNTLLRKSVEDRKDFSAITADKVDHETVYLFMQNFKDGKKTFDAYKTWREDVRRSDKEFDIRFAAFEGGLFEGPVIEKLLSLPSKEESLATLIGLLQSIPQKLIHVLNHVPTEFGRTLAALKSQMEKEEKEKAGTAGPSAPAAAAAAASPAAA